MIVSRARQNENRGNLSLRKECRNLCILSAIALATYAVQSMAWPLSLGRDAPNYLMYYLDLWSAEPVYHLLMVTRTPLAPLTFGSLLSLGGTPLTETVMALFYAAAIVGIYFVARGCNTRLAIPAALIVNFYPAYGSLFHLVETEPLATLSFVWWCVLLMSAVRRPATARFTALGIATFICIMARPSFLLFLSFAIAPFLLLFVKTSFLRKAWYSTAFAIGSGTLLLLWCTHNYVRYGDFTIARTSQAHIPMMRTFCFAHIVQRQNGPASVALADLVKSRLLNKEPYRSYGIDEHQFFLRGTVRMFWDLVPLCDETYGWNDDYHQLRKVGIEAVMAHPWPYARGVIRAFTGLLVLNYREAAPERYYGPEPPKRDASGLPVPTEDDLIPRSYRWQMMSSPGQKMQVDPDSVELRNLGPAVARESAGSR